MISTIDLTNEHGPLSAATEIVSARLIQNGVRLVLAVENSQAVLTLFLTHYQATILHDALDEVLRRIE